jgi:hypothetical protein
MKVTLVCESMFGNTHALVEQVRLGLEEAGATVTHVEVADVVPADLAGDDLVVVAAPTHALSLSRPESRAEAVAHGADPTRSVLGVREWLGRVEDFLPPGAPRPVAAVLDTKVAKARHWPGSAAHRAARGLRSAGLHVVEVTHFYVDAIAGPPCAGEAERAREWGRRLPGLVRDASGRR